MLPKKNRLQKNKDFERVFKKGRFFKEDFLVLKVLFNNLKNSRFGFIVSSKVSKKAVLRNKIKRWLRAAVLSHLEKKADDKTEKSIDIIIIVKPEQPKIKNFQEVKETINKIFKKAGISNQ